jgi:dTMP kinase
MFITLEGPDGSGKTTQILPLADFLHQQGYDVLVTREPGGTAIGDQVRSILFNTANATMHPRTEVLLFQASRAQIVAEVIRPHLARGGVVICDRFADSTLAYQGYGHGLDLEQLRGLIDFATAGLKPDLTIYLDIEVALGLHRRLQGGNWNRLDAYDLDFHQRVRQGYRQLIVAEPQRWVIVDGSKPLEEIQAAIREIVLARLKQHHGRVNIP